MAVSIDRVYQKVLAFANKEQRGYITPQEFNLFADQAQMEIFEQYFYDINQWTRQHGNSHEYSDMLVNLEEKIDVFASIALGDNVTVLNSFGDVNLSTDLPDLYRLGDVRVKYPDTGYVHAEGLRSRKEFALYNSSKLTQSTNQRPIYHRSTSSTGLDRIKIYPYPVEDDGSPFDLSADDIDTSLAHVNITSVVHPGAYTASGQYFYFNESEMTALLGSANWTNVVQNDFTFVRDEQVINIGSVKLWDSSSGNSTAVGPGLGHGRQVPNPGNVNGAGTFKVGDSIYIASDIFQDDQRNVRVDYIRRPITPNWNYVVVNDKALYNSTSSTDFQLHESEESELVYRILAFAGVAIEKPQLTQVAAGLEQAKVQQEKQ